MVQDRIMTIHFNSGEKLGFSFPQQVEEAYVAGMVNNLMKEEKLIVEADGSVFVFPWSSIRYVKVTPPPAQLPGLTVKGAHLVG